MQIFQTVSVVSKYRIELTVQSPDDFIPTQLILISHDKMAQYWETLGRVSFYQRVDIDQFTRIPRAEPNSQPSIQAVHSCVGSMDGG